MKQRKKRKLVGIQMQKTRDVALLQKVLRRVLPEMIAADIRRELKL